MEAAALPARVTGKSLVSDRVVIDTVVANYSDHLPLYRQSAILSVVESRRIKISVRDYLADVLPGLADTSARKLPDLAPAAWAASHRSSQPGIARHLSRTKLLRRMRSIPFCAITPPHFCNRKCPTTMESMPEE